jgi:hypothetical protein
MQSLPMWFSFCIAQNNMVASQNFTVKINSDKNETLELGM